MSITEHSTGKHEGNRRAGSFSSFGFPRHEYFINEGAKTGDILLQTGVIPTHSMDKKRFLYDEGLAMTIESQKNDVKLVISHFGVNIKGERLSGNKKGTIFSGTLILRKERQNTSVYFKAKTKPKKKNRRQAAA